MPDLDATAAADLAVRLGLVTEHQVREIWELRGEKGGEALPFLLALERKGYLTPWQTQKLMRGDLDGYFMGGYRILYKVASGTFGRVFRAEDPQTGTVVALKVLRRRWTEDEHAVDLFEREGQVGLTLDHPNIVRILNLGTDEATGSHFLAMEFVEGGNLREILAIRKKLEPAEALRIAEDAANALAYAYSKGVTHRDMKLTNILISSQGTAKLVDFGLAGVFRYLQQDGSDGQVDRTVDYAGLEKATAVKPGDVRSDIYFLGCVLYEILTGRSPLTMTKNKMMRMARDRFVNVPPMRKEEVNGPPSLFRLVETMMAFNPLQRYQTPSQLLDVIREVRREIEGKAAGGNGQAPSIRSVFVVESDERLQEALRGKFKELGYRVFLAADPGRALDRFRQQPFDALVVDVGTAGEEALLIFERLMKEAERAEIPCCGIVVLSEGQEQLAETVTKRPSVAVMVRPITLKQLHRRLQSLVPPK